MKHIKLFILTVIVLACIHSASCQNRSRFIFGVGVGSGLTYITHEGYDYSDPWNMEEVTQTYLRHSLATNFRIGFAPADNFFICWNSRGHWFPRPMFDEYDEKTTFASGIAGLGVTFFPFRSQPKLYLNGLYGYSNLGEPMERTGNHFGTGLVFGAGYEFFRFFTAEFVIMVSTSEKHESGEMKTPLLANLTLNFLYF